MQIKQKCRKWMKTLVKGSKQIKIALNNKALKLGIKLSSWVAKTTVRLVSILLPAILVLVVLNQPAIWLNRGVPLIHAADHTMIHELFPNSSWDDLEPCGKYLDEQKELDTALQCVNTKVWQDRPLDKSTILPPRCFVLKAQSPNVFSDPKLGFNFIPIIDLGSMGGVVGVYQPETRTIFVVENIDIAMVYRHELQHFFLHLHDPITEGGGHFQPIWNQCEPPYYTPSLKVQVNTKLGK